MKPVFTFCLLLLAAGEIFSQDSHTLWGDVIKIGKTYETQGLYGKDGTSFYLLQLPTGRKNRSIRMDRYATSDLKQLGSVNIAMPDTKGGKCVFEGLYFIQGKLVLFVSLYDRDHHTHSAIALVMSENLDITADWKEIDSYNLEKSRSLGYFAFSTSPGDSLLLLKRNISGAKTDHRKYHFVLLNAQLEARWKKDIELPYENNQIQVPEIFPGPSGNVFLLCALLPDKKKNNPLINDLFSQYLLIGFFPRENVLREYELSLEEKHISAVTARPAIDGNIAVTGFYGRKSQYSLEGTFYISLNTTTRKPDKLSLKPFENEIKMELQDIAGRDDEDLLNNFYFDHFVQNPDSTSYLIAEEYFKQTHSYFDPITQLYYDSYTYHYNDIIIVKLNRDGDIAWGKRIPKRQVTPGGNNLYFSYALASAGNGLFLYFNDHPKNFNGQQRVSDNVYALNKQQYATAAELKVDATGEMTSGRLFDEKNENMMLLPGLCYQAGPETIIICRKKKNQIQFGRIKLVK